MSKFVLNVNPSLRKLLGSKTKEHSLSNEKASLVFVNYTKANDCNGPKVEKVKY